MNLVLPFRPEISHLTVGYMPLLDSAPLLWAVHRGYFRAAGLDVELVGEVSWASLRDRLAYGALDAAQCLAPMPVAATLGADHVGVPMVTGLCLSRGGSAITFSHSMATRIGMTRSMSATQSATAVAHYVRGGGRLRLAHVFPFSMHHYLLCEWLALGGLDVMGRDSGSIELSVAPPPQMVRLLETGAVDGFCVGEPWNTAAVKGGLGFVVTPTSAIWDGGADKVLGVTREWAQQFPNAHRALIAALMAALHELDSRDVTSELTLLMQRAKVLAVPSAWIEAGLRGQVSGIQPRFASGLHAFPRRSQLMWCALQMLRCRQWSGAISLSKLTADVCDGEAYRDAATALGFPSPTIDLVREGSGLVALGADGASIESRFVDGSELDPSNPAAYLTARGWHPDIARSAVAG